MLQIAFHITLVFTPIAGQEEQGGGPFLQFLFRAGKIFPTFCVCMHACTHMHSCFKKYSKQVQKHFEKMKRM